MKRFRTLVTIPVLAALALCFEARQVTAVGQVTELPFIGTYNVSCGYHNSCATTPTAGYGLDFVNTAESTYGDVAYASGNGTVVENDGDPSVSYGYRVVLKHPDNYYTRYAHLSYWFAGMNHKMQLGSPLGYMGSTGNSTGPHLHWQVYYNTTSGQGVNPLPIEGVSAFCGIGQTCGPYTNTSFSTQLRLVDNTDAGFSFSGTATCWNNTSNGFYRGGLEKSVNYYYYCSGTTSSATRTGRWWPSVPSAGVYWIYVFAPSHSGITLTSNAIYKVYSNSRLVGTVAVAQNGYNNDWVRLGSYYLTTSGSFVELTNVVSDGQKVAYDAVMFVRDF